MAEDVHQIRSGYHGICTTVHLVKLAREGKAAARVAEDGVWWAWKGQSRR